MSASLGIGLAAAAGLALVCGGLLATRFKRARRQNAAAVAAARRRIASRRQEAVALAKVHLQRLNPKDTDAAVDAKALRKAKELVEAIEVDPPDVAKYEHLVVHQLYRMARSYHDEAGVKSVGSGPIQQFGADLERQWAERHSGFSTTI